MKCSSRLCETVQFLFNESVPGYGKIFELVKDGEPEIGDIILFPMQSSKNCLGVIFKHATVYCGEGEVVHFQNTSSLKRRGRVSKEGYYAMRKDAGKGKIYRKKDGVDLYAFRCKVREVMNAEELYSFTTNNCIHFALYLLDLVPFYHNLVTMEEPGCGPNSMLLPMSTRRAAKWVEQVPENI